MERNAVVEREVDGPHGRRTVLVTHPHRVILARSGLTKLGVVDYFLSVGEGILAAVRDRPTMLERWRDGEGFFQRRVPRGAPEWVEPVRVEAADGAELDMVCPTELAVIAWAANIGTLTFHPWPSRRDALERPDQLWIDLDPPSEAGFPAAVTIALELRAQLADLGMDAHVKTSGGRGLHTVVPIQPRWEWAVAHRARVALAFALAARVPRLATVERLKRDRGGRVYVDHSPQTVASAYSIRRAADGEALASAPLTWDELPEVHPRDFNIATMPSRFAAVGDLQPDGGDGYDIGSLLELAERLRRDGPGGSPP